MNTTSSSDVPPHKKSRLGLVSIIVLIVFAAVAIIGIVSRVTEAGALKKRTEAAAVPTVTVMTAQQASPTEDIILPGTIQAWHESIIYARTAGYLKKWNVDIGAHVKEGDLLAEIDAPDLDAQYHQAQADLATDIANNKLAQITAKRWIELRKTDSVSQQDTDTKVATAEADQAMVDSAKANLDHLQQQEDFKKIVAPFDGTITQRNIDVGAMIIGSNSDTGQDLFHIADTSKLRVYIQVPENDAPAITPGLKAELHFPERPDQTAVATLSRTAEALDPTTRSLLTEFEVDNADGALMAGGYTDAHIKIPNAATTVILPVNTLLFRDKLSVGVVGQDNHVSLKRIVIGRDYGKKVEVVSGINVGDTIVVNPPDSLSDGQEVRIATPKEKQDQPAKENADQKAK